MLLLLLCSIMVVTVASANSSNIKPIEAGSEIDKAGSTPEWLYLSDEYYSAIKKDLNGFVAYEHIQKREELQIEEKLLESNIKTEPELAQFIKENPDASGLDNMSEDGRFYIDDWYMYYPEMLNNAANVYRIDLDGDLRKLEKTYQLIKMAGAEYLLALIKDTDRTLILPPNMDYAGIEHHMIENGKASLFPMADGIYKVSAEALNPINLNPQYNDMTYLDSINKWEDVIFWNYRLSVSPDETKYVYCSNKDDGKLCKLFLMDLYGNESIIADFPDHDLNICGWVDDEHIAIIETLDMGNNFYIVSTSGHKAKIDLPQNNNESYFYLGSSNGKIAFSTSDRVLLYSVNYNTVARVAEIVLPGDARIREGIDIFDPAGTMIAVVFCRAEDNARGMAVYNATDGSLICEKYAPEGEPSEEIILEIDWVGETQILVAIKNNITKNITSWLYNVEEVRK